MPRGTRKKRRVNPDKAPWDTLPVIVFHPDPADPAAPEPEPVDWGDIGDWLDDWEHNRNHDQNYDPEHLDPKAVVRNGTIVVTRGTFDIADLPSRCLTQLEDHPGEEFVVETDGLGRIDIARRGALVGDELAGIGVENTGFLKPLNLPARDQGEGTLAGYAQALRDHAARALELADTYDQLVADGWDFAPSPPPGVWWPPLRRTPRAGTGSVSGPDEG